MGKSGKSRYFSLHHNHHQRTMLDYKFDKLCGTVHKCGNVLFAPSARTSSSLSSSSSSNSSTALTTTSTTASSTSHNDVLLSAVGNRVSAFDLVQHTTQTLPFESRKNISCMALDPEGRLLLVIDDDGRALCVDYPRRTVLYRFNFKAPVLDCKFSRDGKFFSVTHENKVQVWRSPGRDREFSPFVLHREFTGQYDRTTCVDWRQDSRYFIVGSRDMTARVFSLYPEKKIGFVPVTFAGHRDELVGVFWGEDGKSAYTVSRDAAVFEWRWEPPADGVARNLETSLHRHSGKADTRESTIREEDSDDEFDFMLKKYEKMESTDGPTPALGGGTWKLDKKHFIKLDHAKITCVTYQTASSLLVVGLDSGIFGIYDMPGCTNIHTLSISQHGISTVAINGSGEWLAFGSSALGQLLVWEWRSESYVLKQQGHFYDLNVVAYSPDGRLMVTGGDDSKVKLWNAETGFCFVTFDDHDGPITAVEFAFGETGQAVVTASLDGTVRAFDLARYKNFRTMRTPSERPSQLLSLAVDGNGEVICAGAMEPYEIYLWSMRNGQLLDVLTGHAGPISSLSFSPIEPRLVSGSWDGMVNVWEPYKSTIPLDPFKHKSDVLAVAFSPKGDQICSACLDGTLTFWNIKEGRQVGVIQGRRDITGGRRKNDRRSATASAQGKCFTSVCYTADGTCVLAGGRSKFVCIYHVSQKVLLKKFQLSHNRSLDGVLNFLNSANMTEAGNLEDLHDDEDDIGLGKVDSSMPGARRGKGGKRQTAPEIRCKSVRFSPTGQSWCAATTEGMVVYSIRDDAAFAPYELTEEITPLTVERLLVKNEYGKAVLVALHLSERDVLVRSLLSVPIANVPDVAKTIPVMFVHDVVECLASMLLRTTHLEFVLTWCLNVFRVHGPTIRRSTSSYLRCLRSLQKSISTQRNSLTSMGNETKYLLHFLCLKRGPVGERGGEEGEEEEEEEEEGAKKSGNSGVRQKKKRRLVSEEVD